ncbi:MAG TPA: YbhB/YbcL family Raf kinase inhibitor-like protein [Steroidobacteraceae bacterium]|nr:YbhB/YbcL family Raf kinase inhibitor-like protein [Steroidobacteraceae bacterium]
MRRTERMIGRYRVVLALVGALVLTSPATLAGRSQWSAPEAPQAAAGAQLALQSSDIAPGGTIALQHVYDGSGCRGGNISPALSWSHPPAGTRSFALLMFDPDAPGGGWWHWAVFDIPPGVTSLRAGAGDPASHLLPAGAIQARNDFGSAGYGGPCPPPGSPHHYRLTLYALRMTKLGLGVDAKPAQIDARARAGALAEAQVVGVYGR